MHGYDALLKAATARRLQSSRSFAHAALPGPWAARARHPGFVGVNTLGEPPLSATMASTDVAMYRKPRAVPAFSNPNLPDGGRRGVHPRNNGRARPLADYITRSSLGGLGQEDGPGLLASLALNPGKFALTFGINFAVTWGLIEVLPSYLSDVISRHGSEAGKRKARNRLALWTAGAVTVVNTIMLPYLATE